MNYAGRSRLCLETAVIAALLAKFEEVYLT